MNQILAKSLKNFLVRASIIFFTGLALRSLILYGFDLNVFLHPFNTISLIYYAFMAIYAVIQCELYPTGVATGVATEVATEVPIKVEAPMEAPIAVPMGVPMAMVQDTNPIYFAMNNTTENPSSPPVSPIPSLAEDTLSDIEAETDALVAELDMKTGVIRD